MTFFRFFDMGTKSLEAEVGHTINEPVIYAVKAAIELAVLELVREGEQKKFWEYKGNGAPTSWTERNSLPVRNTPEQNDSSAGGSP